MTILTLKKMLIQDLAKNFFCISTILNKLYIKIYFVISAIDITITFVIFKAKLSLKSVLKFDEECKKI